MAAALMIMGSITGAAPASSSSSMMGSNCLINRPQAIPTPTNHLANPRYRHSSVCSFSPITSGIVTQNSKLRPTFFSASSSRNSSQVPQISSLDQNSNNINHHHQQLLHHPSLSMILEIIALIWRLPGIISGLLNREQRILDQVEGEVDEAADAIKLGAKVVEGLAEGIEKVGEAIGDKKVEEIAETIEEDARRVEVIMDKVKERTKIAHDELEEVAESLGGSMQGVEKIIARVHIQGKTVSKDGSKNSTIEATPGASTSEPSPMMDIGVEKYRSLPLQLTIFSPSKWFFYTLESLSKISQQLLAHPQLWIHSLPISFTKLTLMKSLIMSSFLMTLVMPLPAILLS